MFAEPRARCSFSEILLRFQNEPVERVWSQRYEVGTFSDGRKLGAAKHLDQLESGEGVQVEFYRLHKTRQVCHDQNSLILVLTNEGQHAAIFRCEKLQRAASECF